MTGQEKDGKGRESTRFVFVSRVRYVVRTDHTGEDREGFASNVSVGGLCLTVNQALTAGQEIVITECLLPYCRKAYRVKWCQEAGSGAYRAGLVGIDENAPGAGLK
jgi:hypothetical protein